MNILFGLCEREVASPFYPITLPLKEKNSHEGLQNRKISPEIYSQLLPTSSDNSFLSKLTCPSERVYLSSFYHVRVLQVTGY